MKKLTMILTCLLVCFTLFTACAAQKGDSGQASGINSAVTDKVPQGTDNIDEAGGAGALPDDFSYEPKNPQNNDGIVVTPKE
ncbi:MAG: hypothetical protein Q4G07_07260 [Oscillospiraceae bacterium]|nr:hypothetical protein [Oscillospiraceae bacterium]